MGLCADPLRIGRPARPVRSDGDQGAMIAVALLAAAASWSAPQTVAEGSSVARPQAAFTGAGQPLVVSAPGTVLTYAQRSTATFELVPHGLTTQLRVRFSGGGAHD